MFHNYSWRHFCTLFPLYFLNSSLLAAGQAADAVAPEAATGIQVQTLTHANKFMVATANPVASQAGYDVLKAGGSAIDALVAVQMTLGLVEPQSSGLGGGAFVVYYDAKEQKLTTFDGRETAPMAATPELFQDDKGEPLSFYTAVVGGRSVGTPGTVKLMGELHDKYGTLPWKDLLEPAAKIAQEGFIVSPRLAEAIKGSAEYLSRYPKTKSYFFNYDGTPVEAGSRMTNTAYYKTLNLLAVYGPDEFYTGQIAKDIVSQVQIIADNPGVLSEQDFANYTVKERTPVCLPYKKFDVCGMGPPSSGALTVGQILGITQEFDLAKMGANSPEAWQIIGDASRLAFADRGRYMADTDFVPMPQGLLDKNYLAERAKLITPGKALETVSAGEPEWRHPITQADDISIELPSTSHISIVDKDGNAVSVTTTIENGFGSNVMSNGFLLNNELTDFSFKSHQNGYPIANRLEPGKRPRSSMSPTIIMKDDKPYLVVGSPGGSRIIGYVAKTLIAHIEWGMDIQEAISLPNMLNRFGTYDLEKGTQAERFEKPLTDMGFKVSIKDLNSGIQGIIIEDTGLLGGADPRREGLVLGD
ncbi:gamma-glutamyltransferase [Marinomonas ushuaiensis DSM 15871]|uniref:Glutathione hydrolase proenzyme n=1 Tax=Marinomonas ushuaiensis DSM 15871 TaxID=1122207 RepID=X7E1V5_9GAMM|nr:gamma-glutamyltransferase [Marinomonas ushuaiensis]ETX10049.1 gamma-glutamyltransferase [Marinomonas ushuaiensis DSM 15871]